MTRSSEPDTQAPAQVGTGRTVRLALLAILGVLIVSALVVYPEVAWDFRNNLWGPAHLLLRGENPYDLSHLFEDGQAVWFPQVIGLFFFFGWLPANIASNIWLALNLGALLGIIGLSLGKSRLNPMKLAGIFFCLALWSPVVSHLLFGQYTLLAVLCLMLASHMLEKGRFAWAGGLALIALGKPQIAFLVLAGMGLKLLQEHKWPVWGRFAAGFLSMAVVSTIPLWINYPGWMPAFLVALRGNPVWAQPALISALPILFGGTGMVVAILLGVTATLASLWLWLRRNARQALPWSLALTCIASPYLWSYDFVLFVPVILLVINGERRLQSMATVAGLVVISLGMIWQRWMSAHLDYNFWWVPLAVLAVLLASALYTKNQPEPDRASIL